MVGGPSCTQPRPQSAVRCGAGHRLVAASRHMQHLRHLGKAAQRKVGQQGAELLGLLQVEPVVGTLEEDLRTPGGGRGRPEVAGGTRRAGMGGRPPRHGKVHTWVQPLGRAFKVVRGPEPTGCSRQPPALRPPFLPSKSWSQAPAAHGGRLAGRAAQPPHRVAVGDELAHHFAAVPREHRRLTAHLGGQQCSQGGTEGGAGVAARHARRCRSAHAQLRQQPQAPAEAGRRSPPRRRASLPVCCGAAQLRQFRQFRWFRRYRRVRSPG